MAEKACHVVAFATRIGLIPVLGSMDSDQISVVELDGEGKLHIIPAKNEFHYIYREAMEVAWDIQRRSLHSPVPREWSYARWFQQIIAAAHAQGSRLQLHTGTIWINVPEALREELEQLGAAA